MPVFLLFFYPLLFDISPSTCFIHFASSANTAVSCRLISLAVEVRKEQVKKRTAFYKLYYFVMINIYIYTCLDDLKV